MNKIKPISIPLPLKKQKSSFAQRPPLFYFLFFLPSICFDLSYTLCISPPTPTPISHSGSPVRLQGRGGIVRSDGWLSTFCCLPLRSSEIYTATDYQAWKPISLYIPLARSLLFLSLLSIHLFSTPASSLFYYLKLFCALVKDLENIVYLCTQSTALVHRMVLLNSQRRVLDVVINCAPLWRACCLSWCSVPPACWNPASAHLNTVIITPEKVPLWVIVLSK